MKIDVIIIGIGRVGLPLGLSLSKNGVKCIGVDIDKYTIDSVNNKEMPFMEKGYDEIIKDVDFKATSDYRLIAKASNIIITVGTPLLQHIEIDLSYIKEVINNIIPHLQKYQNIILRSTVAPETTAFIKKYIEKETEFKIGKDLYLSFCPERIAEGKALKELEQLPQIIGSEDDVSFKKAKDVFKNLTKEIFQVTYNEAELVKLFCNVSRYMQFSTVNYLAIIAESYSCDIHKLLTIINTDYPRPIYGKVGATAGTCLRKDWGMINEDIPYADLLLSAYKINEYIPRFLVKQTKLHIDTFEDKEVAILGYAFKKDCDDIRDSLSPKLVRYLEREVPKKIYINDPHVTSKFENDYANESVKKFIQTVDVVYLFINHEVYKKSFEKIYSMVKKDCLFIDLWNVSGRNKIFFRKG